MWKFDVVVVFVHLQNNVNNDADSAQNWEKSYGIR